MRSSVFITFIYLVLIPHYIFGQSMSTYSILVDSTLLKDQPSKVADFFKYFETALSLDNEFKKINSKFGFGINSNQ